METKILSLEEIENSASIKEMLAKETYREDKPDWDNNPPKLTNTGQYMAINYMEHSFESLLATARAYHENKLKDQKCARCYTQPPKITNKDFLGLAKPEDYFGGEKEIRDNIKPEDKPHAPTIKAIIEALKYGENANHEVVATWAIKSLESILK